MSVTPYRELGEVEPDPPEPKKRYSYHLVPRNPYGGMHASHFGFIIGWSIVSIASDQWTWFIPIALYALLTPLVVKIEKKELLPKKRKSWRIALMERQIKELNELAEEKRRDEEEEERAHCVH